MKKLGIHLFVLFTLFALPSLNAQDTLKIQGTYEVGTEEILNLAPGTIVVFEKGAVLLVKGGLEAMGTPEAPIQFISAKPTEPGQGLRIVGNQKNHSVKILHAEFHDLQFMAQFSPFWNRKSVLIEEATVRGIAHGESMIFMAKPIASPDHPISIQLNHIEFFNNSSGLLFEGVGMENIRLEIQDLAFLNNTFSSEFTRMGLIHLDLTQGKFNPNGLVLDNILFHPLSVKNGKGISVSGPAKEIEVGNLYMDGLHTDWIYDYQLNHLLPRLSPTKIHPANDWSGDEFLILNSRHTDQSIFIEYQGNPSTLTLLDENNLPLLYTQTELGENKIQLDYQGGPAINLELRNGRRILLPEQIITLVKEEPNNPYEGEAEKDPTDYMFNLSFLPYKKSNFVGDYEAGIWAGGACYGGGDIKWRYAYLPPDLEYSFGAFLNYRFLKNLSLRGSYYFSRISASNPYAALPLSGHIQPQTLDQNGELFYPFGDSPYFLSSNLNFRTTIHSVEASAMWVPKALQYKVFGHKVEPSLGVGIGLMHFTPYRIKYIDSVNFEKINLRDLGTEGQLFLPGSKKYSQLAGHLDLNFELAWIFGNWKIRGEGKVVFATTDYLDDFGKGIWYGGDYDRFIQKAVEATEYSEKDIRRFNAFRQEIARNSPRSINRFGDWYYQWHLGVSYNLGPQLFKK